MAGMNALQQPDEQLLNDIQSKLCDALVLLDQLKRKVQADASEESAGRDRLARLAIARMQARRINSLILRLDADVLHAFCRLLLDPQHQFRQPNDLLREELGQDVARTTAYRFVDQFREAVAELTQAGDSGAHGAADPTA
jgi:hypothetical protein